MVGHRKRVRTGSFLILGSVSAVSRNERHSLASFLFSQEYELLPGTLLLTMHPAMGQDYSEDWKWRKTFKKNLVFLLLQAV